VRLGRLWCSYRIFCGMMAVPLAIIGAIDAGFVHAPRPAVGVVAVAVVVEMVTEGVFGLGESGVIPSANPGHDTTRGGDFTYPSFSPMAVPEDAPGAFGSALVSLIIAVGMTPAVRRRIHSCIGSLAANGEVRAYATVAELMGRRSPEEVLAHGIQTFRGLPFSALSEMDLRVEPVPRLWKESVITICLHKEEESMAVGLTIDGDDRPPTVIDVKEGSIAAANKHLQKGMHLLKVNGQTCLGHEMATEMIKEAVGDVVLTLSFTVTDVTWALNATAAMETTKWRALHAKTRRAALLQVDAFVSHCWNEDAKQKWAALETWSVERGGEQVIWLDRACLDQSSLDDSLAALPVYIGGCKSFLMLAGETYSSRLWVTSAHVPQPQVAPLHAAHEEKT
jgi:hypothetical protein